VFDPVRFLYSFEAVADREIAALLASSMAYGRVASINAKVAECLRRLPRPLGEAARQGDESRLRACLAGFRHRFSTGEQIARLLAAAGRVACSDGSLGGALAAEIRPGESNVLPALQRWVRRLRDEAGGGLGHLLADPASGSACKRLHLMLRWMVRRDAVDPGGWEGVGPERLLVPLDVHMHRLAERMGLTRRRTPDAKTALEVTAGFARWRPEDPVRYDFALTRLGICEGPAGRELARRLFGSD
jgi:uncharacterized protein (TIGR02757 family)